MLSAPIFVIPGALLFVILSASEGSFPGICSGEKRCFAPLGLSMTGSAAGPFLVSQIERNPLPMISLELTTVMKAPESSLRRNRRSRVASARVSTVTMARSSRRV